MLSLDPSGSVRHLNPWLVGCQIHLGLSIKDDQLVSWSERGKPWQFILDRTLAPEFPFLSKILSFLSFLNPSIGHEMLYFSIIFGLFSWMEPYDHPSMRDLNYTSTARVFKKGDEKIITKPKWICKEWKVINWFFVGWHRKQIFDKAKCGILSYLECKFC